MQPGYVTAIALAVLALALIAVLWRRAAPAGAALEGLRDDKAALERQLAIEKERNSRLTGLQQELAESRREAGEQRAAREDLRVRLAALEETLAKERAQGAEKLKLLEDARERMGAEFRLLADAVMQRHSESFTRQNKEQLELVLQPLGEKLAEFQQGLQAARTEGAGIRASLEQQIRTLTEATAQTNKEARDLAQALKAKAQTQGAWGEMILGTILERSGLREGEEYAVQETHATEDGERLRPDVIVRLPREGRLVIDSKVSLTAFEAYVNAEADDDRHAALARHLDSVRAHIRALGAKQYQALINSGLDYVIMFVPIEGALAAALAADPALSALAGECNVAIATPTTLMIALRTVRNVWQMERRTQNAEQIAERAGKLYEKFVGFVTDMKLLGERLGKARECYDAAYKKLWEGSGNLVRQTEQLKELGAKATKALPPELLALAQDAGETEAVAESS